MIGVKVGNVSVITTNGSTLGPDHWAKRASDQVVSVGKDAHPLIAEQAIEFKKSIYSAVHYYMYEAIKEDRSRIVDLLRSAGHNDLANSVEKL
jgi:hypothetical protein|tara:strand:+ start:1497 stop:1775 length:279 start_codon:yes stop_codon:yes gene_type:complete